NDVSDLSYLIILDNEFNSCPGEDIYYVLGPPVGFDVTVLLAKVLDFRESHALDALFHQRLFDLADLEPPHGRLDPFHRPSLWRVRKIVRKRLDQFGAKTPLTDESSRH